MFGPCNANPNTQGRIPDRIHRITRNLQAEEDWLVDIVREQNDSPAALCSFFFLNLLHPVNPVKNASRV